MARKPILRRGSGGVGDGRVPLSGPMIQGSSLSLDRACRRACDVRSAQRLRAALLAFCSCRYCGSPELMSLAFFCGFVLLLGLGWFSDYLNSSPFSLCWEVFKTLCVVKKFVVQDVFGWRGSGSQVTGARWMRLDCVREFYLPSILFVFSWDFCVVCYFVLVKERLFCEMLLWWRIFCPSRDLATSDVELLVSRDSILLLFHVHFVVYMVDHAFQNASQCSGRSVVILSGEQNPLSFDPMSSS